MKSIIAIFTLALFSISINGNATGITENLKTTEELQIRISGSVIDSKTGEALAGVKIKILGTTYEAYTNFDGIFEFKNLEPGKYSIECQMVCYELLNLNGLIIGTINNENNIVLRLTPSSIKIQPKPKKYQPIACG